MPESSEAQIAALLLQINAIKLSPQNPFIWASGIESPIYCDNRMVLSYPEVRDAMVAALVAQSAQFADFDTIAGVATAGIPHGALLADRLQLPFIYVREKPKSHGRQNQIEGHLAKNARVLVIEDLISTGGSSLKAVETLREAGANVVGTLAIFTYGFEQATHAFEMAKCPLVTLSNYPTLLEQALKQNYISEADLITLQAWRQSPQTWSPTKH
jgi:orotate phosphoribosyltransferase